MTVRNPQDPYAIDRILKLRVSDAEIRFRHACDDLTKAKDALLRFRIKQRGKEQRGSDA